MDQPFLTYSLSFNHDRRRRKLPELRITMSDSMLTHTEEILRSSRIMEVVDINEYLRKSIGNPWQEPELVFDGKARRPFGIGQCGYVTSVDGRSHIHFPYESSSLSYVVMTLHVLLISLGLSMEREQAGTNQHQLCSVTTRCTHSHMGWGHSMCGNIYPTFWRWLASLDGVVREAIEQKISESVLEAYVAFASKDKRRKLRKFWRYTCRSIIGDHGRFIICCPGDACDIAIYPEGDFIQDD